MRRAVRLTMGALVLDVLPDGRVVVALPMERVPFGAVVQATVVYPSLRAFLAGVRARRP